MSDSNQAQCDPTEQTLYEESHSDQWRSFKDRLFRCGPDGKVGIGICVGGNCSVRPLKGWMALDEQIQAADKLAEAVKAIASSAPCMDGHESFNSPGQPCDQRIATEALAAYEAVRRKHD